MSRYNSLGIAIQLMETIKTTMKENGSGTEKTDAVIRDLQDIAKDVRYGGEWDGDFETVVTALELCREPGKQCGICPYNKDHTLCTLNMKTDARHAIRYLSKALKEAEAKLAATGGGTEPAEESPPGPAAWQIVDMETGNTPPEKFQWDEEEPV